MTEHVALMADACESTTRGEFDDRLQALLSRDDRGVANDEHVILANAIVENTIAGAFQLDPPTQNRAIQAINRHILAGNMLKARQAAHGSAVAPVSDGRIQALLRDKYPAAADLPVDPPIDIDAQEIRAQLIHLPLHSDSLMSYIMRKRRGASVGLNGFSNDHYQDILRHNPDAIHHLTSICNLIAAGIPTDGAARKLLLEGKGTALLKSNGDVRPIVTEDPLLSYTGHALATEHRDVIRTVCGDGLTGWLRGCGPLRTLFARS
jgi:hypothetical protein